MFSDRTNAVINELELSFDKNKPIYCSVTKLLNNELVQEEIKTIEDNVNCIESELKNSKIQLIKPEGTYQVWLDFSNVFTNTKEMFSHITENSGVALNAGHWFGREGALFMRMSVATSKQNVTDAINRLKKGILDYK